MTAVGASEISGESAEKQSLDDKGESRAWIPPFGTLLLCQMLVFASYGATQPFLPLFFRELGESEAGAIAWTGIINTALGLSLVLVTPLWGVFADRVGQKKMFLRGIFGGAISVGLLGAAMAPWHVLLLRIMVGAAGGVSATSAALAASIVPASRLTMGMGLLLTIQSLGNALGPSAGGIGSNIIGYRGVFIVSGLFMAAVGIAATFLIREPAKAASSEKKRTAYQQIGAVLSAPHLRLPILTSFFSHGAVIISTTLLSLQVKQLTSDDSAGNTLVGAVLTANAVGLALGATVFGSLAGKIGNRTTAIGALAASAVLATAQAWITDPTLFIVVRAFGGLAAGGVLPVIQGQLAREVSNDPQFRSQLGSVYGVAQSAFSFASVLAPALSAFVGATWGIPSIQIFAGAVFALTAIGYLVFGTGKGAANKAA